ncbi:MAG TPA: hypothetical protein PK765_04935 [bacterium]|nr:hypothetical protein [bacterium]
MRTFFASVGAVEPETWDYYCNDERVLAICKNRKAGTILDTWYLLRFGKRIGTMENGEFVPDFTLLRDITSDAPRYAMSEDEYSRFRTGEHLTTSETRFENGGHVVAERDGVVVGTLRANGSILENLISKSLKKR